MANLRLKKTILEIVDNQLRDGAPPTAKRAFYSLLDAGYTRKEAKEKIGAVVLTEIYDVMKENQPYNEERYTQALEEMVQRSIDFEDGHELPTEWKEWEKLVESGYTVQYGRGLGPLIDSWWKAWEILKTIVSQREGKTSVSKLEEELDYEYEVSGWLDDLEMELGDAGEDEKRLEFCRAVLEMFDWTNDDNSNFLSAIGEALYETGKKEEGREWFEDWLKKEPHNENAWSAYCWCVEKDEGAQKAYQLIRGEVIGVPCTMDNDMLFERAEDLAEELQLDDDLKEIRSQIDSFHAARKKGLGHDGSEDGELPFYDDDFYLSQQKPLVKEKKIYPNDPCPCGSGKKYKKCCGKR